MKESVYIIPLSGGDHHTTDWKLMEFLLAQTFSLRCELVVEKREGKEIDLALITNLNEYFKYARDPKFIELAEFYALLYISHEDEGTLEKALIEDCWGRIKISSQELKKLHPAKTLNYVSTHYCQEIEEARGYNQMIHVSKSKDWILGVEEDDFDDLQNKTLVEIQHCPFCGARLV